VRFYRARASGFPKGAGHAKLGTRSTVESFGKANDFNVGGTAVDNSVPRLTSEGH
jgi:hypothetical protein